MRQTLNYNLKYFDSGKECEKKICIKFISHFVNKKYAELVEEITNFKKTYNDYTQSLIDSGEILAKRDKGWKDKLKVAEEKRETFKCELETFKDSDVFKDRIDLIMIILSDNGVDDKELMDLSFWERKVEESVMMDFINQCVYKDNAQTDRKTGKKKK